MATDRAALLAEAKKVVLASPRISVIALAEKLPIGYQLASELLAELVANQVIEWYADSHGLHYRIVGK